MTYYNIPKYQKRRIEKIEIIEHVIKNIEKQLKIF